MRPSPAPVFTRRELLRSAFKTLAELALLRLMGQALPAAAAKAHKDEVAYQDKPNGNQRCSSCRQFAATGGGKGTCSIVEGEVSSSGWCSAYSPRGTSQSQAAPPVNPFTPMRTVQVRHVAVPRTAHTEEGVHI